VVETYLLTTRTPHPIPLKPLKLLYDVAKVDVANLDVAFEEIARAILELPEGVYVLVQAGLPVLCSFAALMLYQRFQRVKVAQFDVAEQTYYFYEFPNIRDFME